MRPVFVYLLLLNGYVAAISIGVWTNIHDFYPLCPNFTSYEILQAFRIGLVAVLGTALPTVREKHYTIWESYKTENQSYSNDVYNNILLFLLFLTIGLTYLYCYIHRDIFIDSYIFALRNVLQDEKYEAMFIPVQNLDFAIFTFGLIYIVYNHRWNRSIPFWVAVGLNILLHIMIGSRAGIIIFLVMIFWRYYTQFGIKWVDKPFFKMASFIIVIFLVGCMAVYRTWTSKGSLSLNLTNPFFTVSLEMLNGTISAFNTVHFMDIGKGPPLFLPFLDAFFGAIPAQLYPEKRGLLFFESWYKSIGGHEVLCPRGGFFLPAQIYSFTGTILGVFLYFCLFSVFLKWAYRKLFEKRKIAIMAGLVASSQIIFFSTRHPCWIQLKSIILWVVIFPVIFYLLSDILKLKGYAKTKLKSACQSRIESSE